MNNLINNSVNGQSTTNATSSTLAVKTASIGREADNNADSALQSTSFFDSIQQAKNTARQGADHQKTHEDSLVDGGNRLPITDNDSALAAEADRLPQPVQSQSNQPLPDQVLPDTLLPGILQANQLISNDQLNAAAEKILNIEQSTQKIPLQDVSIQSASIPAAVGKFISNPAIIDDPLKSSLPTVTTFPVHITNKLAESTLIPNATDIANTNTSQQSVLSKSVNGKFVHNDNVLNISGSSMPKTINPELDLKTNTSVMDANKQALLSSTLPITALSTVSTELFASSITQAGFSAQSGLGEITSEALVAENSVLTSTRSQVQYLSTPAAVSPALPVSDDLAKILPAQITPTQINPAQINPVQTNPVQTNPVQTNLGEQEQLVAQVAQSIAINKQSLLAPGVIATDVAELITTTGASQNSTVQIESARPNILNIPVAVQAEGTKQMTMPNGLSAQSDANKQFLLAQSMAAQIEANTSLASTSTTTISSTAGETTASILPLPTNSPLNNHLAFNLQAVTQTEISEVFTRPAWPKGMAKQVLWMVNQNINSAEIRLNPARLGPIEVMIDMREEQVTVSLTSRHAMVREAMEQALPKLREMLEENGFNLADTDISQHSFSEQHEQASAEERNHLNTENTTQLVSGEVNHQSPQQGGATSTVVDYYI